MPIPQKMRASGLLRAAGQAPMVRNGECDRCGRETALLDRQVDERHGHFLGHWPHGGRVGSVGYGQQVRDVRLRRGVIAFAEPDGEMVAEDGRDAMSEPGSARRSAV